jgi:hypothetical protein
MTKQVRASICFELPREEEAAALAAVTAAWHRFSEELKAISGVHVWGDSFVMKRSLGPKSGNPRLYAVKSGSAA